jgi:hypothetical protein
MMSANPHNASAFTRHRGRKLAIEVKQALAKCDEGYQQACSPSRIAKQGEHPDDSMRFSLVLRRNQWP